jgi:hypothetical protein
MVKAGTQGHAALGQKSESHEVWLGREDRSLLSSIFGPMGIRRAQQIQASI